MFASKIHRTMATSSPYTRSVVSAMRKLYPEALADKSFDNTGLLLESPFDPRRRQKNSVLLTIDLTTAVADEAIRRQDSVVVAYHPIIFRGLKALTMKDTQQQSLLRLAAAGISVYSPHTAVDCAAGGLGDWLADIVTGTSNSAPSEQSPFDADSQPQGRPTHMLQHHPSQLSIKDSRAFSRGASKHERYPITPAKVSGHEGAGMGRIIRFPSPVPLTEIIDRITLGLGNPKGFPIAVPQGKQISDMNISSIALCAGSGGSLFSEAEKKGENVDLYFTGELSHHEALAAIENGKCVIALFHSNTERGFLHGVLKEQLEGQVRKEWDNLRQDEDVKQEAKKHGYPEALDEDHVEVHVSEVDRDPYGIMVSRD
ncbi:related to NGG1 interacting factor Nif3 [Ramularia collo-cygni]|uniref:Related to NGG1 interacting factor Nif3 n=1 Tax=Ramularia collo-cygni TaxID=112498 RepID=A0A2D3UNY1_9PEZI|nr:related to NGG1 interacting factor Nif3 [Ramularia collo-cygni]CZT14335.1 related to NGG1 interacting factor Nif3 [Ramularia collo-cygni]